MGMNRRTFTKFLGSLIALPRLPWSGPRVYDLEQIPALPQVGDVCRMMLHLGEGKFGVGIAHGDAKAAVGYWEKSLQNPPMQRVDMECVEVDANGVGRFQRVIRNGLRRSVEVRAAKDATHTGDGVAVVIRSFCCLQEAVDDPSSFDDHVSRRRIHGKMPLFLPAGDFPPLVQEGRFEIGPGRFSQFDEGGMRLGINTVEPYWSNANG